jgi:tRNA(Ile)-lysidine synthase
MDRIPVARANTAYLVRPLLDVPKARLIATLKAAKVPYVIDPSNADPRFTRPRLRTLMPLLAAEGLTAERLRRLARRAQRIEAAMFAALNAAQIALCPPPWPERAPLSADAQAFLGLPEEIGLRLLGRMIAHVGQAGGPELGQLEVLYSELQTFRSTPLRRNLAGALVALSAAKLTVEREPPRRINAKSQKSKRKVRFTTVG